MAIVQGTSSAETLSGTNQSDVITGAAGNDVFVFNNVVVQNDVVTDFGTVYFGGAIQGSQEVPPNSSAASGTWAAHLNKNQTQFTFSAAISGLDLGGQTPATVDNVTAAHFHRQVVGASGGVVYGFIGAPFNDLDGDIAVNAAAGTVNGQWDANEGNGAANTLALLVPNLLNNEIYINFHTPVFPGGEIRGQAFRLDEGRDVIDLRGTGIGDMATLQQFMSESGGNTTLSMQWNGQASTLMLQGVSMARLSAADFMFTDAGARGFTGSGGADDIVGAAGAEILNGGGGNDRVWGGAGNDVLDGGGGNDDVKADAGNDIAGGGDGNDSVRGMDGDDIITGGAGDDVHLNGNVGADQVRGGEGNDTIYGGRGNDELWGEDGNDWLSGDLGIDRMTGGSGADRFLFRTGARDDVVLDFSFAEGDRVQLAPGTAYTQSGGVITLSSGDTLTLIGGGTFSSDWIVFA